jgi:NAD(P)-dependent dehydrogenase (short-subunit alcohol dehydrogenase family)
VSLEGKRIVVIGGGSGMGLAVAHAVADQGAEVVISGRTVQKLEEAASDIAGHVEIEQVDLTDEDSVAQLFERVGTLDHLVVTGASGSTGDFLSQPVDEAQNFMESKFWGAFRSARYAALRLPDGGSITFNSGGFAVKPTAGVAALTASLAALEMLGKSLALELARDSPVERDVRVRPSRTFRGGCKQGTRG